MEITCWAACEFSPPPLQPKGGHRSPGAGQPFSPEVSRSGWATAGPRGTLPPQGAAESSPQPLPLLVTAPDEPRSERLHRKRKAIFSDVSQIFLRHYLFLHFHWSFRQDQKPERKTSSFRDLTLKIATSSTYFRHTHTHAHTQSCKDNKRLLLERRSRESASFASCRLQNWRINWKHLIRDAEPCNIMIYLTQSNNGQRQWIIQEMTKLQEISVI